MFTCSLCGAEYEHQTYTRIHVCQDCFDSPMEYEGMFVKINGEVIVVEDAHMAMPYGHAAQYFAWLYNNAKRK